MATDRQSQARVLRARLDILRQELLAPVLSIEGYVELLRDNLDIPECLADLATIGKAVEQTRALVDEMLQAEQEGRDDATRDRQRSVFKHDLRNSVGAIAGYAEMILEELEDRSAGASDEAAWLNHLVEDANTLLDLLDTMFRSDDMFGEDAEESLNVDIHSIFESFERSDREGSEAITGHILIVDDNESSRNYLAHKLRRQGHTVRTGKSGREALELMREEVPDTLLLDLFMHDMNGFEVLRELHKDEELRAVPVIVITGLKDKSAAVRCIEAGAFDIIIKPVNPALLEARVSSCLEKKAWRDKEQAYQRDLEKSHAFIRKVFGRYLSDEVVREILESDDGMELGGAKQRITIMMTDIRGFSVLSQELDAEDCVTILNNYFGVMTPLIQKYDGVINEFLGDAILAIFGAPVVSEDHAQKALACAIEMQQGMSRVNKLNRELDLPAIEMGIALNTGEVVVGNIGSERRAKYGVVGHHVNFAARVESYTTGGQVLVSDGAHKACNGLLRSTKAMTVQPKGFDDEVTLHDVTGIGGVYDLTVPE